MKIAITASGPTLDSPVDQRFGRASRFILFDTKTRDHTTIDNTQALDSAQGAGIQAAETVVARGRRMSHHRTLRTEGVSRPFGCRNPHLYRGKRKRCGSDRRI